MMGRVVGNFYRFLGKDVISVVLIKIIRKVFKQI